MTTATKSEKKTICQILAERDTALLDVRLPLDEFAKLLTVRYDNRWKYHDWRVSGNEDLYYWIYDHIIRDKKNAEKISDEQVIECAYEHFRAIQARQGQINFHSVYIKDCEEIELIPRKNYRENATVRVVKDRLDGLYRFSTTYTVGSGYAPSFGASENITASRNEALLKGAREISGSIKNSWEYKCGDRLVYQIFVRKIESFIQTIEAEIIQPSLFW